MFVPKLRAPQRRVASRHVRAYLPPPLVFKSRREAPVRTITKVHIGEQASSQSAVLARRIAMVIAMVIATIQQSMPLMRRRAATLLVGASVALMLMVGVGVGLGLVGGRTPPLTRVPAVANATASTSSASSASPIARIRPFPQCPGGVSPCP